MRIGITLPGTIPTANTPNNQRKKKRKIIDKFDLLRSQ
jgi:hypothetical protein